MKTLLATVAAAAVTLGASAASAQEPLVAAPSTQWYVSLFGGFAFKANINGQYYGSSNLDLQANHGFLVGGAFGTWLTPSVRTEIELTYVRRSVSDPNFMEDPDWCGSPDPYCDARGTLAALYVLGNAWFHPMGQGRFSPYVGIGAGMAVLKPDLSLYEGGGYDPDTYVWDDKRIAPAAQLGIGVQFAMNDRLTIDASYRMRAVLGGVFADADPANAPDPPYPYSADGVTWLDHGLQIGVNFAF